MTPSAPEWPIYPDPAAGGSADYMKGEKRIELSYTVELTRNYGLIVPPEETGPIVKRFFEVIKVFGDAGTMGPYTTLFNTALLVFGMLVMQVYEGAHEENRYVVLRALTALLDMMIFTLSSIYTGGLASVLTIPRYGRPIDTLREMADSNILWAAQDEAFVFSIRGTGDPILDHLNENFRVLDEEELAVRALRGDMGFVMEVLSGGSCCFSSHLTPRAMAKLRIMREPLYWSHIIFIFRKSSPYIEKFNNLVYKMRESGIMYYWEGEVARKFNSGCGPGPQYDAGPTKLQLGHVQGAFFALGFGLMASLLVFCWELLKAGGGKRIKNRRHKGPC